MKFNIASIVLSAAVMLSAAGMEISAKSPKRGVGEDSFSLGCQMEALTPGVSWFYTWGATPKAGYKNQVIDFTGYDFVPMTWNANYDPDKIREYCQAHPNVKYILGFNEPNFTKQANMTPTAAAEAWPALKALADELGLKLVSPALNFSPNPPYQDPVKWMDEFVALVGLDAFDYVAIHNYGGLGVMKSFATTFHEKYGKDVWVTEFCYWPEEGNSNAQVAQSTQIASMIESLEWLEKTPWIYRYAWFKPIGQYNTDGSQTGPRYGLLERQKNGQLEVSELSEQGYVYVYMSSFDESVYHPVAELIPASEYISQGGIQLGKGANEKSPRPIEITSFNAGASADYQIDVPESGDYTLELTVSGQGEPVRFDPTIGVYAVNADGTDGAELAAPVRFTLSGNNETYTVQKFALALSAGKQTIRIKDGNPYEPSGIRISTLRLVSGAGINDIVAGENTPVDVYTLQGVKIRSQVMPAEAIDGLPAGLYIVGKQKVYVRN